MSFKTKQQAEDRAIEIKALMNQPGAWTIRVWENAGWHFTLLCGGLSLIESDLPLKNGRFWCLLSFTIPGADELRWPSNLYFKDPNDAVGYQLKPTSDVVAQEVLALGEIKEKLAGLSKAG